MPTMRPQATSAPTPTRCAMAARGTIANPAALTSMTTATARPVVIRSRSPLPHQATLIRGRDSAPSTSPVAQVWPVSCRATRGSAIAVARLPIQLTKATVMIVITAARTRIPTTLPAAHARR